MDWLDAAVAGVFGLLVVWLQHRLSRRVKRVEHHAAAARYQVENNHTTNLREESDERHGETLTKLDLALQGIAGLGHELREIHEVQRDHRTRIRNIEQRELQKEDHE